MPTVRASLRSLPALLAVLVAGCTPGAQGRGGAPSVASAGRAMPAPAVDVALTVARTVSVALDRIDQRDLPLDRTYRHFGTGRGISIYVFDGGVLDTHPELVGRVRRGFDAFPGDERVCNAHGTAVAGAVAGRTLGVAPEARIVDVKMVECGRVRGSIDAIVRATEWVLEDHARHPERRAVANWSFVADTGASVPALNDAVARLRAAGIPVVVSAGNVEVDACHISPANAPGAIVVGASQVRRGTPASWVDGRAPRTAFGRCLDVFAPGDSVLLPGMDLEGLPVSQLWNGTSMSAGYVSGAVALFLETHPTASVGDVRAHITASSSAARVDPRSPRAGMLYVGSGAGTPRVSFRQTSR
ncbi:MAG: Alkaline serine exoprotease precursor [Gemmatimonadetes bacterium]|nr:Alkaline serine exoprotease precursor [Gemmatimonadota bacterium]